MKKYALAFLGLGLLFKLVITPLFFILHNFKSQRFANRCQHLNAMAPMMVRAIIATNYGLKPKPSNMMASSGIPLSFLPLAIWYFILSQF
ncbi:MAG: hypothetical protein R2790_02350 [Flavobacterium haoranii]